MFSLTVDGRALTVIVGQTCKMFKTLLKIHKVDEAVTFHTCLLHYPLHKLCFCCDQVRTLVAMATFFRCGGYTWPIVR